MVREDLINSAVSFLQDPSVATSTLEQRLSFLRSKNLTQEEIDISLARAGDGSSVTNSPPPLPAGQPNYSYLNQHVTRQPTFQPYQGSPWGPPPELPRRDWRDWFIMATVSTGVSYGLYTVAKRYILPLISPPTPPQIASDKASIDESFSRAFALIDQLAADTASLKSSEVERTEKLDTTLRDVEGVISDLKAANLRREAESKILASQVQGLKDLVPKALEGWKSAGDQKLDDLGAELRSLKKLVGNRIGTGSGSQTSLGKTYPSFSAKDKPSASEASSPDPLVKGAGDLEDGLPSSPAPVSSTTIAERGAPSGYRNSGKASIPEWQMLSTNEKSIGETSSKGDETSEQEAKN